MLNMNLIDPRLIVSNDDETYTLSNGAQPVTVWNRISDFVESCEQAELAAFIDYVQPNVRVNR